MKLRGTAASGQGGHLREVTQEDEGPVMPVTSSVARTGMPQPPTAPSRDGSTPSSAIPYTERTAEGKGPYWG